MNLVALLIAPAIVALSVGSSESAPIRYGISAIAIAIIVGAVVVSKRRESSLHAEEPLNA